MRSMKHLAEAKAALAAGKFSEAKRHAKLAKKSLNAVEDAIKDLDKAREKDEELKEKKDNNEE